MDSGAATVASASAMISPTSPTAGRHSIQSAPVNGSKSHVDPVFKRRATRVTTGLKAQTVNTSIRNKNFKVGQEPGLDPTKKDGGRKEIPQRHEECQITVVDYSEEEMEMRDFDNKELIEFMHKPQEDWVKVRWINVNGISWDVIQAIGDAKKLHRLALEDLTNIENRTKVDW